VIRIGTGAALKNEDFKSTYVFFLKNAGKIYDGNPAIDFHDVLQEEFNECEGYPNDFYEWFQFLTRYRNQEQK
jgi:hypothetical protein